MLAHLEYLTTRFPLETFENRILSFVNALQLSQDPPVLAQLETGEPVMGLSARETEALKQRIRFPC